MLSNPTLSPDKIHSETDQALASPHLLLEHVKAVLLPHLRSFNLIAVEGPPVQWLVNVTERTDRLLVTLCNNSPQAWRGTIRPKGAGVLSARNLMTDTELSGGSEVGLEVAPLDVVVLELLLTRPMFEVKA